MIFPQLTILVHPGRDTKRARDRGRSKRDQKNVYAQKNFLFELQLSHDLGLGVRAWEFVANPLVFWSSHALFFLFIFFSPSAHVPVLLFCSTSSGQSGRNREKGSERYINQQLLFFHFTNRH